MLHLPHQRSVGSGVSWCPRRGCYLVGRFASSGAFVLLIVLVVTVTILGLGSGVGGGGGIQRTCQQREHRGRTGAGEFCQRCVSRGRRVRLPCSQEGGHTPPQDGKKRLHRVLAHGANALGSIHLRQRLRGQRASGGPNWGCLPRLPQHKAETPAAVVGRAVIGAAPCLLVGDLNPGVGLVGSLAALAVVSVGASSTAPPRVLHPRFEAHRVVQLYPHNVLGARIDFPLDRAKRGARCSSTTLEDAVGATHGATCATQNTEAAQVAVTVDVDGQPVLRAHPPATDDLGEPWHLVGGGWFHAHCRCACQPT